MKHSLYLPKEYHVDRPARWPFILFLHGAGERGDDIKLLKSTGLPNILEKKDIPFIVASPQCPAGKQWSTDLLIGLIENILGKYRIDEDRIYLTGISMGGYATWYLSIKFPYMFAAIAPMCGGGFPGQVHKIKHVPVWAFHGALDKTVPPERTKEMVAALRNCGADVRFTLYPDAGHDCWTRSYSNPELYEWFLQHRRCKVKSDE